MFSLLKIARGEKQYNFVILQDIQGHFLIIARRLRAQFSPYLLFRIQA